MTYENTPPVPVKKRVKNTTIQNSVRGWEFEKG
jgi:hypothetical protein